VIAGIILAAGASSRMGGSPKALLLLGGETFVERLVRVFAEVASPVIVALGYHADAILPRIAGKATVVVNAAPERGQFSSLQTALAAVPADAEGFFFTPVDSPAVALETVKLVVAAFAGRAADTLFVIPRYQGKRGHPVCATRAMAEEMLALPATAQARDVVHEHVARTQYVDVDDPGILTDIDTQEAYQSMLERAK
jgi:molybdenum cofactor cytidylyltransferase